VNLLIYYFRDVLQLSDIAYFANVLWTFVMITEKRFKVTYAVLLLIIALIHNWFNLCQKLLFKNVHSNCTCETKVYQDHLWYVTSCRPVTVTQWDKYDINISFSMFLMQVNLSETIPNTIYTHSTFNNFWTWGYKSMSSIFVCKNIYFLFLVFHCELMQNTQSYEYEYDG
jgi:hypothetical protein